jgi:hypothetical protein
MRSLFVGPVTRLHGPFVRCPAHVQRRIGTALARCCDKQRRALRFPRDNMAIAARAASVIAVRARLA